MGLLQRVFGQSRNHVWVDFASEVGGQYIDGTLMMPGKVTIPTGRWVVTFDQFEPGRKNETFTRLRVPYRNLDQFRFVVYPERLGAKVAKLFGMQDIQTGDANFDETFVIKGSAERRIRQFFEDATIRSLLLAQPDLLLYARDDEGQ